MLRRSKPPSKFRRRASRTAPSWLCSETFTPILANTPQAAEIFRDAITRNPDNDQYYLSLALVQLRENNVGGAEQTLRKGLARIPGSGKILWGLGIVSVLEGKTPQAAEDLERAVDLFPEWPGSYSTLGVFYYQTGEIAKAREVLNRFKGSNAAGGLDVNRIEEALSRAPDVPSAIREPYADGCQAAITSARAVARRPDTLKARRKLAVERADGRG